MKVLGINAVFHDPAAALLVDGKIVAATEEERFSRRKHGKRPVPFSTWELPVAAAEWCLEEGGLKAEDLDAVAYSYDPQLAPSGDGDLIASEWEGLRTLYAARAPRFLETALPGLDGERVEFVAHHVAHAASAYLAGPERNAAVLVVDGRGERTSALLGHAQDGRLRPLSTQPLPDSLGLLYEELTAHLGFLRSSDEYKVMALAAYGQPRYLDHFRSLMTTDGEGHFHTEPVAWDRFCPAAPPDGADGPRLEEEHADLAASVQTRLEEVLLELAGWLHAHTGEEALVLAGGVALNCVANARLARESPFRRVWAQPASGDAGTALGAAAYLAESRGDRVSPMTTAALGRQFSDQEIEAALRTARVPFERPADLADAVAAIIAQDGIVAWFQGRSEWGPRALGHRSLLANPSRAENLGRLNDVKGREQFRPIAPMVLEDRAAEMFDGQLPSPYMLFTHRVLDGWGARLPATTHVDGTARIQTVNRDEEPLLARLLEAFQARTGLPVLVNTSLNVAGRPIVDSIRDALECWGSTPLDALAIGPYLLRRTAWAG
ncbi:MAG: carbamoyltransferase [Candidatus Dormibacteraeota bacterium]|nr:carbamoyltransferase [Candidatus Dormibacteraeota bacterium]